MPSHVDRPPAEKFDELVIKVFKGLRKPKKRQIKAGGESKNKAVAMVQRQMQLKNYAEQQEADDMYKMMFGVEDLDIRRKKPVRNEDVSRTLNEGSEHGEEETFENPKPIIENTLKNMTSPQPESLKYKSNPSSTSLTHTKSFSGARGQTVQLKESKLSLAHQTFETVDQIKSGGATSTVMSPVTSGVTLTANLPQVPS